MVPMTLSSFIVPRPPALPGVAMTLMWTTVSTSSRAITLAMTGLRMSARTNWTSPMSPRGGITSTPITRSTDGSLARDRAQVRPRSRETPVTRTVRPLIPNDSRLPQTKGTATPRTGRGSLAELAALHPRLLQELAVLLLRHALAPLLDDRTHVDLSNTPDPAARHSTTAAPTEVGRLDPAYPPRRASGESGAAMRGTSHRRGCPRLSSCRQRASPRDRVNCGRQRGARGEDDPRHARPISQPAL